MLFNKTLYSVILFCALLITHRKKSFKFALMNESLNSLRKGLSVSIFENVKRHSTCATKLQGV